MELRFQQAVPNLLHAPKAAAFLDVVFNVTRGRPLAPSTPHDQERLPPFVRWDSEVQRGLPLNVLRFQLYPDRLADMPIPVESSGERLELVKVVLRDDGARPVAVFAPDFACPGRCPLQEISDINDVIGSSFGAKEYLLALSAALAHHKFRDYMEFFYVFDLHTNPLIWENLSIQQEDPALWLDPGLVGDHIRLATAVKTTIVRLMGRLADRVHSSTTPVFPPYDPSLEAYRDTRVLSELQIGLFSKLSIKAVERAFELFASGGLRCRLDNLAIASQPSSAYYFLFGEFALMALDNGMEVEKWTELSRVLLRTQPVFAKTYAPPSQSSGLTFDSYVATNYCGRKVGSKDLAALKREYEGANSLAEKASLNAKCYLDGM